jgi:hypothetical protein
MRNFLSILILTFIFQSVIGQDKIFTKDKNQLNVKIVEKTNRLVKYKMIDYEDGPILSISNYRISKIEYKNGYIDLMGFQNPRKNKPFGISAGYVRWVSEEGGMFSSTLDYFIIPQIDLELNIGTDLEDGLYFSGGSRFHLSSDFSVKKFTPFTGLLFGSEFGDGFLQIPIGINYLTKPGFNTSLSLNQMFFFNSWQATLLELRIGWRFRL